MNPIRKFFGKIFNFKAAEPPPPKVEHFNLPAPKPSVVRRVFTTHKRRTSKPQTEPHQTGFGTFTRLKHICGHAVTPLNRAQKRDFEKLWKVKVK
jgi:hypothetical protein